MTTRTRWIVLLVSTPIVAFVVIVDHGGRFYTLYGHLASIDVSKGAAVQAGDDIGTVGMAPTGAPSLYFEVRIDGRPADPVQWLKPVSSRSPA